MKRIALACLIALLGMSVGASRVHAQVPGAAFTGGGDSQLDYLTPGCQPGPNIQASPCLWFSVGSGSATLDGSQFTFQYSLVMNILLGQGSLQDGLFCAPAQGAMGMRGLTGQGASTITMTLVGSACRQGSSWDLAGQFAATGTSGMLQRGAGAGSFTAMVNADRPGGGCIMWDGTFILIGL